jgi:hypothetical protein
MEVLIKVAEAELLMFGHADAHVSSMSMLTRHLDVKERDIWMLRSETSGC